MSAPARRYRALPALLALPLAVAPVGAIAAASPARASAAAVCEAPASASPVISEESWALNRYDLLSLGRVSRGGGVTVAVLDSGVDAHHPQLRGAVVGGGDFLDGTSTGAEDCLGHGTAVASIIAARPSDGTTLAGLAPEATILSIRVSSRIQTETGLVGNGDVSALVAGIREAVRARPRPAVINLSISTDRDSEDLREAIQAALDADIVVVAAVGNRYNLGNPTPYPAAYEGVVGVGAIDWSGARYDQSQVGSYVDLVAPGDGVLVAARGGGQMVQAGTSFAAPFVAATAALIRAKWPELDRAEVVRRLLATADPPSGGQPSPDYGYGVVNPLRAITAVLPEPAAAHTPTPAPALEPRASADAARVTPSAVVLAATGALLLGTGLIVAAALATPAGRRRRWRPGRATTGDYDWPEP